MENNPHRVVVLAQDGAYPFELGIPARIFGAAGGVYSVSLCSATGEPIETNAGFSVVPGAGAEALCDADTIIVVPVDPRYLKRELSDDVRDALSQVRPGTRIVSICTGGFTLAAAGLLTDRVATTHWLCAPIFQEWFPLVDLDENVLFVDEDDVLTSAGAAAGIDLCLHIIRKDFGADLATKVARQCVVAPYRDGGQLQFIDRPVPAVADATTGPAREWALARLSDQLTVRDLAEQAHMSERTFVRRFQAETGLAPRKWLTQERLMVARGLLESTDLGIDSIAAAVGYATATSLRKHLDALLGMTPRAYRYTYRAASSGPRRPAGRRSDSHAPAESAEDTATPVLLGSL